MSTRVPGAGPVHLPVMRDEPEPSHPLGWIADADPQASRRTFTQLIGGTLALAGAGAACRRPEQQIVPYVHRPVGLTPGNPLHFATAHALEGYGAGLLVRSHEGRPTKVEGNPQHPDSRGASTAFDQGLVMGLVDEQRARQLSHRGRPIAWRRFTADVADLMGRQAQTGGAGLRFLTEPTSSPVIADLRSRVGERWPKARFATTSSAAPVGATEGTRLAFGRPLEARVRIDAAAVIVSVDADFLGEGPAQLPMNRAFARRRDPDGPMNRLYVVEPAMTITGGMADHRLPLRAGDGLAFLRALAAALARRPGLGALGGFGGDVPAGVDPAWVEAVADDLHRNRGAGLILPGRRQPAAAHALAHALDEALGNLGRTVTLAPPVLVDPDSGPAALNRLCQEIDAGQVELLVITAWNPVYGAPADFAIADRLTLVPEVIYHALYEDETAAVASYVVPAAHLLESWGDVRGTDGAVALVQPLIDPLWGGVDEVRLYATLLGEAEKTSRDLVRRRWQARAPESFEAAWARWLGEGVVPDTVIEPIEAPSVRRAEVQAALAEAPAPSQAWELAFALDARVWDGRFANNAWLMELPEPVTKLTWDNAALLSEASAQRLGVETGDMLRLSRAGRTLQAAALIAPGHVDGAITLPLGFGRFGAGERVARGVGFRAGVLRTSDAFWIAGGASAQKTAQRHRFAITQDHFRMEGRDHAVQTTAAALGTESFHERMAHRRGPLPTMYDPFDYAEVPYRWGMAIDLGLCTGCSACVIACQAENNVPVVGKRNVELGREMHWLRIDRYFVGPTSNPQMITQPMLCVHCETAPCEYVCPTNATVHSDEGLNEMVYNRCIGTRYCSNNCPYKVRRFNYLAYLRQFEDFDRLRMNPEVTVRGRGVMEKCTYCVQRIQNARIRAKIEGRAIREGEVVTACAQACPTGAIVFGSLHDPEALVTRLHADRRRYDVLHELGTRPRTAFLARVRNPNPALEARG